MRLRALLAALLLLLPSLTVAQVGALAHEGERSDAIPGSAQLQGADLLLAVSAAAHPVSVGWRIAGESGAGVTHRGLDLHGPDLLRLHAPSALEAPPTGARVRPLPPSGIPRGIHRGAWTTSTPPPPGTT